MKRTAVAVFLARLVLVLALGLAAALVLVAVAFLGAALVFVAVAVFFGAAAFFGAAVLVLGLVAVFYSIVSAHSQWDIENVKCTLAAAGFLAGLSAFGAAASFFASLTVPEDPNVKSDNQHHVYKLKTSMNL